jgi:hypothetical protein
MTWTLLSACLPVSTTTEREKKNKTIGSRRNFNGSAKKKKKINF